MNSVHSSNMKAIALDAIGALKRYMRSDSPKIRAAAYKSFQSHTNALVHMPDQVETARLYSCWLKQELPVRHL